MPLLLGFWAQYAAQASMRRRLFELVQDVWKQGGGGDGGGFFSLAVFRHHVKYETFQCPAFSALLPTSAYFR